MGRSPLQRGQWPRAGVPRMQDAASVHGVILAWQHGRTPNHCSKTTSRPRWYVVTGAEPLVAGTGVEIWSGLNLS